MDFGQVLVVDIEATCWAKSKPESAREIIQVGFCTYSRFDGERKDKTSVLVKPTYSDVSEYCVELTGIQPLQLLVAGTLEQACAALEKHRSRKMVWASYGSFDKNQFERECYYKCIDYPFSLSHINVMTLFALRRGLKHEVGLSAALEMLEKPFEGTPHDAADDAWNTAVILDWCLRPPESETP